MSLVAKARWALRHPARNTSATAVLTRLALWRALTALGVGATVPLTGSGLRFWCPPEWHGNAKLAYVWRDDYESEIPQLRRWVGSGDTVVDVGAHYGAYTLPLARLVGDKGTVIAVEPAGHARAVLARNLRINRLDNVRVLPVAAGAEAARLMLRQPLDRSRASLREDHATGAGAAELVEVARLDDVIVPSGSRVSLMKMDVEGYEPQALEGAMNLLARDRPVVIFEFLPGGEGSGTEPSALRAWRLLAGLGYRMHRVTDDGEVVAVDTPDQHCGSTGNIVAIHPGAGPQRGARHGARSGAVR